MLSLSPSGCLLDMLLQFPFPFLIFPTDFPISNFSFLNFEADCFSHLSH